MWQIVWSDEDKQWLAVAPLGVVACRFPTAAQAEEYLDQVIYRQGAQHGTDTGD